MHFCLKLIYSEKAKKFGAIFLMASKPWGRFRPIFWVFSENLNFMWQSQSQSNHFNFLYYTKENWFVQPDCPTRQMLTWNEWFLTNWNFKKFPVHWILDRVRWVKEFLIWSTEISFILPKKLIGLKGISVFCENLAIILENKVPLNLKLF